MSLPHPDQRRRFIALWPSAAEQEQTAQLAEAIPGGRRITPASIHLTLVFLGATDAERMRCYLEALQGIEVPSLTLTLDRLGYWPKPRILWLGPSRTPLALTVLVAELNRRLTACGFAPEARPFRAHITLARKFPGPLPAGLPAEPISWIISQLALVESVNHQDGSRYQVLNRWP